MSMPVEKIAVPSDSDSLHRALQDKIASRQIELPLLPEIAGQALTLVEDRNADAAGLAHLIHRDQALAGHLIRIANSPAFLPKTQIVSLQQAVARLGFRAIAEISMAMVLKGRLFKVAGHETLVSELCRRAFATGVWAKEIARALRYNVESAFLCGLLHEIGKPVVVHEASDLSEKPGAGIEPNELAQLMQDFYVPVGTLLAEKWQLPDPVKGVIAHYRDYREATEFRKEAMLIHCAHAFAEAFLEHDEQDIEALSSLAVLADLNLYPEDVAALMDKAASVVETVEVMSR